MGSNQYNTIDVLVIWFESFLKRSFSITQWVISFWFLGNYQYSGNISKNITLQQWSRYKTIVFELTIYRLCIYGYLDIVKVQVPFLQYLHFKRAK